MTDEWLKLVGSGEPPAAAPPQDANAHDTFLLEEGLDVLAAYRSIGDAKLRLALRDIIIKTAADYQAAVDAEKGA